MPKPIKEAPKDGTVILSDQGFCFFSEERGFWLDCGPDRSLHYDSWDEPYECEPRQWEPAPEWIAALYPNVYPKSKETQ
jgi:hypothetical protein